MLVILCFNCKSGGILLRAPINGFSRPLKSLLKMLKFYCCPMQNKIENSDDQLFAHTSPGGMWQPADQTLHRIHQASHTLIREAYRADLVRQCLQCIS